MKTPIPLMKKLSLITVLFFYVLNSSYSSSQIKRDSLINEFNNIQKNDTLKIKVANEIAFEYVRSNLKDSCAQYLDISKSLLADNDYKNGQAIYHRVNAYYNFNMGNHEKSFEEIEISLSLFEELEDYQGVSNTLNVYGFLLKNYGELDKALEILNKAYELSLKIDYQLNQSVIINNIASILSNQGERVKALDYFNKAIELDLKFDNKVNLASTYTNLALLYQYQDNNDSALFYHNKSLKIFKELKEDNRIIGCLNNIANIQRLRSNYIDALKNFQEAIEYSEKLNNVRLKAITLNNMGNIYYAIGEFDNAIEKYQEAAELSKTFDKSAYAGAISNVSMIYEQQGKHEFALDLLYKALEIYESQKYLPYLVSTHNNIGSNQFKSGNYEASEEAYKKAIELNVENGSKYSGLYSFYGLAEIYYYKNNLKEALINAKKAFDYASAVKASKEISLCAELLYKINKDKKNYKEALSYFEINKTIADSLLDKEKSREMGKLEAELEYKNLAEKLKLENDKNLLEKEAKLNNQKYFLTVMGLSIFALIIVILLVLRLKRNREIANNNLLEERKKIEKQNKELQDLHLQKNKLFSIIAHDLRGPLNTLSWFIETAMKGKLTKEEIDLLLPEINKNLSNTKVLTENLLNWASRSMNEYFKTKENVNIYNIVEDKYILFESSLTNKNITLKNLISKDQNIYFDTNALEVIFRNLISNSIKFCKSGDSITVSFNEEIEFSKICIEDTGVGMNKETAEKLFTDNSLTSQLGTENEKGSGIGLMLCKNFIVENGGRIWVEYSEIGKGTKICFTIPNKD